MTELLAVISGITIAVMILLNGDLSAAYGSFTSTVFIHLSGLLIICLVLLIKKEERPQRGTVPLYLLSGGVIGVFTVVANIFTFSALGVSTTLALGLLGQSGLSLLIDRFGWFGLPRQRMHPRKLLGLGVIALGAAVMLLY